MTYLSQMLVLGALRLLPWWLGSSPRKADATSIAICESLWTMVYDLRSYDDDDDDDNDGGGDATKVVVVVEEEEIN